MKKKDIHNDFFNNIIKDKQNFIDFLRITIPEEIFREINFL